MKVSDLIEELNKMPQHFDVRVHVDSSQEEEGYVEATNFINCVHKPDGLVMLIFKSKSND